MKDIKNDKKWSTYSVTHQYLMSIAAIGVAYFISSEIFPVISKARPYSLFLIASYVIALLCGFKPALFTLLTGFLLANYQFVEPIGAIGLPETTEDYVDISVIILSTIAVLYLIDKYQRERFKNKLLLLVSESRQQILLHRENQRLMALNKSKSEVNNDYR